MRKNIIELVVALAVASLAAAGLVEASGYQGQSGYMPIAILALATLLSLAWAGQCLYGLRARTGEVIRPDLSTALRLSGFALAVAAYVLGVTYVGFFTSTLLMLPLLSAFLGYRNWRVSVGVAVGFVAILYCVFQLLLSIPLPPEAVIQFARGL